MRLERELENLRFQNPGPEMVNTEEHRRTREPRTKKQVTVDSEPESSSDQKTSRKGKKTTQQKAYDDHGILIETKQDLCDCLDEKCPGCWMPCPSCGGTKCGIHCRKNRKFVYTKVLSQSKHCDVEHPFHQRRFIPKN